MNDFTKEELQLLNLSLRINLTWYPVDVAIKLAEKIQSMIDNYCEHGKIGEVRDVDFVKVCNHCQEVTGWQ